MMSGSESVAEPAPVPAAPPPVERSILLNILPHVLDTLRREPALAITLAYLLVALAGIFYNYSYYEKFGIPVLSLSQISDFLVAGIQQPVAILLVLTTFPMCWLFDRVNARNRRRNALRLERMRASPGTAARWRMAYVHWRVHQRSLTYGMYVLVIAVYGWTFVRLYANDQVRAVRRGDAPQVAVWVSDQADGLMAKSGRSWTYLGAIANYVFVYDPVERRSVILPVDNIERIEPLPVAGGGPQASPVR
jgi:hypothetical protein